MKFFFYSFLKLCASHVEFGSRNKVDNISNPMRLSTNKINVKSETIQKSLEKKIQMKHDLTHKRQKISIQMLAPIMVPYTRIGVISIMSVLLVM